MSNIFQNKDLIYKYNRNRDGSIVPPKIFLYTRTLKRIGQIDPVFDLNIVPNLNEANTCSFTIYKKNNGMEKPIFDRIKNLSVIRIEGFGLFEIRVSVTEDQTVCKKITGTSLQESELGQYDCTMEINTDSDIARTDYNKDYPTLFYRDLSSADTPEKRELFAQSSLLHRILTYAPTYTIGHVDDSLMGINREFSCSDSTVYDFLQEVAEEVGCIFLFTPDKREINAYDLEEHCLNCGGRHIIDGVCQSCGSQNDGKEKKIQPGYGLDTSVYVDTSTIVESIEDTVDVDQVKNCFKLVAGDDETTNRIGQRLIGNSNYIWTFGEEQLEEFSDELRDKWTEYQKYVETFQPRFHELWDEYNRKLSEISEYEYSKMPVSETVITDDPSGTCAQIYEEIQAKIPYYAIGSANAVESTITKNILKYANFICPQGYVVEYQKDQYGKDRVQTTITHDNDSNLNVISGFSAWLYIYVPNCKDESGKDDKYFYKAEDPWKLEVRPGYKKYADKASKDAPEVFSHDYYLYLKQMIDFKMAKSDGMYKPKYDTDYLNGQPDPDDKYYYKEYFKEFAIERLKSFLDAYETCVVILHELDENLAANELQQKYHYIIKVDEDGNATVSDQTMYEVLMEKYTAFADKIRRILDEYTSIVTNLKEENEAILNEIKEINEACNIKNYLGTELYNELISFKREQTYENQNFTSNVVDESVLMENVEEFILRARQEIAKACRFQHSVPISMSNLLTLTPYEQFFDVFALGNYIRTRINGELVKLRIISIPFDFENVEQCEVVFSDALVGNQVLRDMQKNTLKAQSMATSFDYVQKQSTKNDQQLSSFTQMFSEGLDATKSMIMNADNETVVFDSHGILGREMEEDTGEYTDYQYRLTSKGIAFTDDNWGSIKTALGKIRWGDNWKYGLIADTIVGRMLVGEQLTIENKTGSVKITGEGIAVTNGSLCLSNDNYSVEIDPNHENDSTLDKYLICARDKKKSGDQGIIFSIGTNGDAYFKGKIRSESGYFNGEMISTEGMIGGWDINDGYLSYGDVSSNNFIRLNANSTSGALISKSGSSQLTLTSGYLQFFYNGCQMLKLHSTYWENNSNMQGIAINSEAKSKFISFGNKNNDSETSYITKFVINYGLNPNGYTEDVLVYGTSRFTNKIILSSGEYIHGSAYTGIYVSKGLASPKIYAGNHDHGGDYALDVNGSAYLNNGLYFSNECYFDAFSTSDGPGIYCNGRFSTAAQVFVGNVDYGYSLNVNGSCYINGNIVANNIPTSSNISSIDITENNVGQYINLNTRDGETFGIYYNVSDTKLKKNIQASEIIALDKIKQIDFIQYDWKKYFRHVDLGVSANQLGEIIPEAVDDIRQSEGSEYDYIKNINPNILINYALKAIKELSETINRQQTEIELLKQSISS